MIRYIKNIGHLLLAVAANIWYGFPSRKAIIIGVTGTDGKTTTTSLLYHVLKQTGKKTAMITTVGAYIGNTVYDVGFHVTTPSPFAIQRYIKKAVDEGNTHIFLEITSHALDQHRAWGIEFLIGVLTNITHEHLDYHKTYENYVQAKVRLLNASKTAVINAGDASYPYVLKYLHTKDIKQYSVEKIAGQSTVTWKESGLKTNLLGDFNRANILAASSVLLLLGVNKSAFQQGLDTYTLPPGRQEILNTKNPLVMVDFAHTPNSLAQILPELRRKTKGRLIHVFGSAGERDATKRPEMGAFAAASDDIVILTSEDPRSESAEEICKQIRSGMNEWNSVPAGYVPKKGERRLVYTIVSRKEAIQKALSLAGADDTVVCTGKGHETSMNYGAGEEPWNEREVIQSLLTR
jgi:UDP-N-acetylmuramoyl-L-alanyl-D-glutamate--2,6-diaminopimelate ligase